jgi:hypothetical protein
MASTVCWGALIYSPYLYFPRISSSPRIGKRPHGMPGSPVTLEQQGVQGTFSTLSPGLRNSGAIEFKRFRAAHRPSPIIRAAMSTSPSSAAEKKPPTHCLKFTEAFS